MPQGEQDLQTLRQHLRSPTYYCLVHGFFFNIRSYKKASYLTVLALNTTTICKNQIQVCENIYYKDDDFDSRQIPLFYLARLIKLRMEMGTLSKRQQSYQKRDKQSLYKYLLQNQNNHIFGTQNLQQFLYFIR